MTLDAAKAYAENYFAPPQDRDPKGTAMTLIAREKAQRDEKTARLKALRQQAAVGAQ